MKKNSLTIRSVTFAAIAGLSLGIAAPGSIAVAQDNATEQTQEVQKGNINFNKKGSLTLHKKKGAESSTAATGQEMDGVEGEALPGVTFKITKLNFDLEKGDWTKFPKTAADVKDTDKSKTTFEETTGADGKVSFKNLDLGIYLVEETDAPAGIVSGAPFIVSIPMVNKASDAWNYDVVAYPKNSETKTEKTVKDADKNIQDDFSYTITADAPTWGEGKSLTAFGFSDQLDPRLEFQKVTEVKAGETTLVEGDYTVNKPADNDNKLVVTLTEQGLAKVTSGAKMSLSFDVKRKEVGESLALKNKAEVFFNNPNTNKDVKNETNEVVTYHGKLKVVKKDGEEEGKVLEGAKFKLYQCTSADELGAQVKIGDVEEWTTGKDGSFTIDGLHVTDYADDKPVTEIKKYCLEETEAPAGYAKLDKPVEVDFKRSDINPNFAEQDNTVTLEKDIENVKQDTPNLPMTGGMGVGILAAIGAAIVAAGAWFARRGAKN